MNEFSTYLEDLKEKGSKIEKQLDKTMSHYEEGIELQEPELLKKGQEELLNTQDLLDELYDFIIGMQSMPTQGE